MITQFKDPGSPKVRNMKHVYNIIRKHGPVTKSSIIEKTAQKQTTCARIIDDLLQEGLIIESGIGISSGGRKPVMYAINTNQLFSIGIDISRTFTKVLLLDLHLNVIDEASFQMNKESTPKKTIDFIQSTIVQMLNSRNIEQDQLIGIGIGAVEPLDREKGIIVDPVNFPSDHWNNVKVVEVLQKKYSTKIILDSGINTAVLAEHKLGLNEEIGNLSYIIAGVGLRIGVMNDHRLLKSDADRFGKLGSGHMVINTNGKKCICGDYGCFHTYSTILYLKANIIHQLKRGHPSILTEGLEDPDDITFEDICTALEAGDDLCVTTVRDFGFFTGIALSNMITMLHSDYLVLSGPMFNRLDLFFETAVTTASNRISKLYPGYDVKFKKGHLGENAAAIGAGSMVLDYYLE
ncbi:ROK family protein [Oceanobacillus polygoni]|uniref:NBD/HSP70 family sugar kinase n=1 Tax=Oceanobacillus polygoni TaxID=1235259 RepID=A0A9X0YNG8_9BACI|nr:ROK family protein [Oceanobacillus polygoni]MBP2076035.1 putative NBD/HSP70 family sugar kinase [Oceanobacillus polygoni]